MIQIVLGRKYTDVHGAERTNFKQALTRSGHVEVGGKNTAPGIPILIPTIDLVYKDFNRIVDMLPPEERWDVYYCCAHHSGAGSDNKPTRLKTTFLRQDIFPIDIDHIDVSRIFEYAAIVADVLRGPVSGLTIVVSGNGGHFIARLKHPIRSAEYFDQKDCYRSIIDLIDEAILKKDLPGNADPAIFDATRLLRLPGTDNRKSGTTQCSVVQYSHAVWDIDLSELSGVSKRKTLHVSPSERKRIYPTPDFNEMVKECRFVASTLTDPDQVHEPDFFLLQTLLAQCDPSATTETQRGRVTPHALAALVFSKATASESLAKADFSEKWLQASKYGAPKCTTIEGQWKQGCVGCPHQGKIPTPVALKGKNHIGSVSGGYWARHPKTGALLHPHYSDLAKVYKNRFPYVVAEGGRIIRYSGTHYKSIEDLEIKAWLECTVDPSDGLRESHRMEFLHKIKASGAIDGVRMGNFFSDSVMGKLNCKNGILDICKGVMMPHSSEYGFLYTLPYHMDPDGPGSDVFLQWLGPITGDRPELIDAILDVMAYTLWPSYDDHVFTFLTGEGSNGKSTLIHLIMAMLGKENYATVSLQQLSGNRFMPALLEGKLVNLSEESSGGDETHAMSIDATNILKTLSSGGDTTAERKGRDGFTFKNQAKLIFSINKPPRFRESGHALKRRLLVIPFDHKIEDVDPKVEAQLLAEIPKIMSLLVRRIQDNVSQNNGAFKINRGSTVTGPAQRALLLNGSTIGEWAKECIESTAELGKDCFVTNAESYDYYRRWCEENGMKNVATRITFSKTMRDAIITRAALIEPDRKWINGQTVRIFPYTRFKMRIM